MLSRAAIAVLAAFLVVSGAGVSAKLSASQRARPARKAAVASHSVMSSHASSLPVLGAAPELGSKGPWINSAPLTLQALRGKVVLVHFWTFACINCQRTLPQVKEAWKTYKDRGFVVIGVHSPELAFEKSEKNVREAVIKDGITYPVVIDGDFATWNAYQNRYWPAFYLIDTKDAIRYIHFGEEPDELRADIEALSQE